MGDPRLDDHPRWDVFWIHHEAEELRVHHRASIPVADARALVVSLLASGRVPPLQATLFDIESLAGRPVLHRFWGTACRCGEIVYLILFINDRCLVLIISE